jgi:hypothetical protein
MTELVDVGVLVLLNDTGRSPLYGLAAMQERHVNGQLPPWSTKQSTELQDEQRS